MEGEVRGTKGKWEEMEGEEERGSLECCPRLPPAAGGVCVCVCLSACLYVSMCLLCVLCDSPL